MKTTVIFGGDTNLFGVGNVEAPFNKVMHVLNQADVRFANLECGFFDATGKPKPADGFPAHPSAARALKIAGFNAMGTANNGNYGDEAIMSTLKTLDSLGIQHTGSGANSKEAHEPAIVDAKGAKVGILQRTFVYWPIGHEAGEHTPGVAAMQAHTAYRVPQHRSGPKAPPLNRPGMPAEVMTWADPQYLERLREDVRQLRSKCDVVVASFHWGRKRDVLDYMAETAHAVIDAGADVVVGHGPHHPMAVEVYKGRPIFYSLAHLSFDVGHGKSGDWLGAMARVVFDGSKPVEIALRWVRHNAANETYFCDLGNEMQTFEDVVSRSKAYGTTFTIAGDEIKIAL